MNAEVSAQARKVEQSFGVVAEAYSRVKTANGTIDMNVAAECMKAAAEFFVDLWRLMVATFRAVMEAISGDRNTPITDEAIAAFLIDNA